MARGFYTGQVNGFYPIGGPSFFAYTKSFIEWNKENNHTTYKRAINNIRANALDWTNVVSNQKIMYNLEIMIRKARAAELDFLAKYNLGNPGDDWSELIKAFNYFLNTKSNFEQAVARIKQEAKGQTPTDGGYVDISAYIGGYIYAAAQEVLGRYGSGKIVTMNLNGPDGDKLVTNIMILALKKMAKARQWVLETGPNAGTIYTNAKQVEKMKKQGYTFTETRPYEDLLDIINQIINSPLLAHMIDTFDLKSKLIEAQQAAMTTGRMRKTQFRIDTARRGDLKGSFYEELKTFVGSEIGSIHIRNNTGNSTLSIDGIREGQTGYKPDEVLMTATLTPLVSSLVSDWTHTGKDTANRPQQIERMREFYKKLEGAKGDIIFVSDKNYIIDSKFKSKGFEAQGPTKLKNLGSMLSTLHMNQDEVEGLIFFLMNCGTDMILGNSDQELLTAFATQIGHFLFDDMEISLNVPQGINAIHLLNLTGIYMPISVYLEAVMNSILQLENSSELNDLVKLTYTPANATPYQPYRDYEDWKNFQVNMLQSKVTIKFMANFAQFISQHVKI